MGGEREGRRGVLFSPSRDRVTPTTGAVFYSGTSYGATAAAFVHDKGANRRRRQKFQGEEPSLLRRSLASVGALALFAFAVTTVTTANNRRLEPGQLRAPSAETAFIRVRWRVLASCHTARSSFFRRF